MTVGGGECERTRGTPLYQVCVHSSLLKIKPVMNQFETVMFLLPLLVVNKCLIILALTYTLLEHLLTF